MKLREGMKVICSRGKVRLVGKNGCHPDIWIAEKGKKLVLIRQSDITAVKNECGYQTIF